MKKKLNTLLPTAALCLALLAVAGVAANSLKGLPAAAVYPQRDFSKFSKTGRWNVVKVVGADRLIIRNASKQRTVKLVGVADPETEWPKAAPPANHLLAVEFLSNLLAGEEVFVLETQRNTADHGALDTVRLFRVPDGLYVNLEMVRQGYAKLSPRGLGNELDLFRTYQERARLTGKGIWNKLSALVPVVTEPRGVTVYVTKTGKKYHSQDCQFLSKSKIALGLGEAKKRGFTPCRICKPPKQ